MHQSVTWSSLTEVTSRYKAMHQSKLPGPVWHRSPTGTKLCTCQLPGPVWQRSPASTKLCTSQLPGPVWQRSPAGTKLCTSQLPGPVWQRSPAGTKYASVSYLVQFDRGHQQVQSYTLVSYLVQFDRGHQQVQSYAPAKLTWSSLTEVTGICNTLSTSPTASLQICSTISETAGEATPISLSRTDRICNKNHVS